MKEIRNIITREGKKELQKELQHLIEIERPKIINEISEARKQGDLSENAEFDAARNKQGQIEDRIREIEKILDTSKVVFSTNSSKVRIGSKVTIMNLKTNGKEEYSIVGTLETNPLENKISNISPLGSKLMGKEVSKDAIKIEALPSYEVQIIKIN